MFLKIFDNEDYETFVRDIDVSDRRIEIMDQDGRLLLQVMIKGEKLERMMVL